MSKGTDRRIVPEYEQGYEDGTRSANADWAIMLDEVVYPYTKTHEVDVWDIADVEQWLRAELGRNR